MNCCSGFVGSKLVSCLKWIQFHGSCRWWFGAGIENSDTIVYFSDLGSNRYSMQILMRFGEDFYLDFVQNQPSTNALSAKNVYFLLFLKKKF